ncbi:hypothetical protein [Vibrio parahaemolyticus]|uniref:hypothetical protein n=1 Tax=Vibrio parahaemolyticus TaxID=670 RepID=UPI001E42E9F8|nr:hypothetical protein [Vibrio parahaemolyticus]ELB2136392.1 hypothetical protein [Vibrio parahaemolyticus]MCQ9048938.1 hypothetical protein [Vibrio parahaemolyticus]
MSNWTKNLLGIGLFVILCVMAWRFYNHADGSIGIFDGTVSITGGVKPKEDECRDISHGVERYLQSEEWGIQSGWEKGGPNRGEFCESKRVEHAQTNPDRKVILINAQTSHKTEHNPFKQDYYRHTCSFEDRWEPLYILKASDAC